MTKNIIVVDEHGKKYGTTYLKRAKGLVKQGRARFLARNMLCLACPPDQYLEDKDMSEQTIENMATEKESMEQEGSKYSIEYCLEQIERIGSQTEYLNQVLADMCGSGGERALALGDIVKCRETTNQQMLRFYEKMYDDLKPPVKVDVITQKTHLQEQLFKLMDKALENDILASADDVTDLFNGAFDAIRHISDH